MKLYCKKTISLGIILILVFLVVSAVVTANSYPEEVMAARGSVFIILTEDEYGMSVGTGFGIGDDKSEIRYIVTNYHVIELSNGTTDPDNIDIVIDLENRIKVKKIIIEMPLTDIAVLELARPIRNCKPLIFENENKIKEGNKVWALGYPGVILEDALMRNDDQAVRSIMRSVPDNVWTGDGHYTRDITVGGTLFYENTTDISPGCSGGPLVNEKGYVIAINTIGYVEGVKGSVPISTLIPRLDDHGIPYEMAKERSNNMILFIAASVIIIAGILANPLRKKIPNYPIEKTFLSPSEPNINLYEEPKIDLYEEPKIDLYEEPKIELQPELEIEIGQESEDAESEDNKKTKEDVDDMDIKLN